MKNIKVKAFGVTDFVNPKRYDKPLSELIKEATGRLGLDYCIECTGVASLLNEAIASTKILLGVLLLLLQQQTTCSIG